MEQARTMIPLLPSYIDGVKKKPPASINFTTVSEFLRNPLLDAI